MRHRRHVNGNSNAQVFATSVDASVSLRWGSGRTVPANATSTSKRVVPPVVVTDTAAQQIPPKTAKQVKRTRSARTRRPQSSTGSRNSVTACHPMRRIQSARSASKRNLSSDVAGQATSGTFIGDNIIPKLQSQIGDFAEPPNSRNKAPDPKQKLTNPTSSESASGTDANNRVQWAVKEASTAPTGQTTYPIEPTELRDLRRLLQDRYDEKRSVRRAFLAWDTNKDGQLCVEEVRDMLTQLGFDQALGQKKVDTILQHVLTMPAASVDYNDFCGLVHGPPEHNQPASNSSYSCASSSKRATDNVRVEEEVVPASDPDCVVSLLRTKYESHRLHQIFRDWDIDKNGGVTMAEIESNLRHQGLRITKPQLMKLFDTYDLNHDGQLLYDEFMRLVYGPVHEMRFSYLAEQRRKKQQHLQNQEGDPLDFFRNWTLPQQKYRSVDVDRDTLQRKLKAFASGLNDSYGALDDDHNEDLSYSDLCNRLQELGLKFTEREFLQLATRADTDGSATRDEDKRVEGHHDSHSPTTQDKDSGQRHRDIGTFNFSHLTRRTKIPTRCGRTPFTNTKGIISDNQADDTSQARFTTEAQLYGSRSSSQLDSSTKVIAMLGQEEKQRRDAATANRLQRLNVQMERYEAQARLLQDTYNIAQERRVRTLQRHQERYYQSIEEQRQRHTLSPVRRGIKIPRSNS